ncbi:MAG TPA: permease [Anaeromyxobacteraceae bacterium]|nr:permease [Anaeromyxobacteraceae bacterium]
MERLPGIAKPSRSRVAGWTELDGRDVRVSEAEVSARGGPVLLLNGLFSTGRTLRVLRRRLRRDGHHVFSVRPDGLAGRFNTGRVEVLARMVAARVEALYRLQPRLAPLTVVGHSKGGLVAAYWVKRLGGHRFVRTVVTLGTPHQGSPMAWLALPVAPLAPAILQLVSRSAFVRRLREGAWPAHVSLVSMFSRRDRLVPYPHALVDRDFDPQVRNIEVESSHAEFLVKRHVYDALRVAIGDEATAPAAGVAA